MDPKLEIPIEIRANTAGAKQAEQAVQQVGNAAAKAGQQTQRMGEAGRKGFNDFSKAGNDAANIVGNLERASQGGIQGVFGLANAVRALINVVRAGVASTGPLGLLVTVVGTLGGLFLALTSRSKASGDELVKTGTKADDLKTKLQELEKAAKASLEAQVGEVKKLGAAYDDVIGKIDAAQARIARLNELRTKEALATLDTAEKQALVAAKTDEEKEAIRRDFAARREATSDSAATAALENRLLNAGVREDAARAAQAQQSAQIRGAEGQLRAATSQREAADYAVSTLFSELQKAIAERSELGDSLNTKEKATRANELDRRIPELEKEIGKAKEQRQLALAAESAAFDNVKTVTIEAQQVINQADEQIAQAEGEREVVPIEQNILRQQRAGRETVQSAEQQGQIRALETEAQRAMNAGDYAAQDKAVAQIRALRATPSAAPVQVGAGDTRRVQGPADDQRLQIHWEKVVSSTAQMADAAERSAQAVVQNTQRTTQALQTTTRAQEKQSNRMKDLRP